MKAAVCRAFGEPLSVEEVELDGPRADEVRVRVSACAICHSDVAYIEGAWDGPLPAVYGHEAAGVVEEVGAGVEDVRPGDHVVVTIVRACGACRACSREEPTLCETRFPLDEQSPLRSADGAEIAQGLRTAAFAEETVVHSSQVVGIPPDVEPAVASLLACGVITGWGAAVTTAKVAAGDSVVVIGVGGVGLNSVQAAAFVGARPVVAVDLAEAKLELATRLGATHAVNSASEDVAEVVRWLTGGRGADHVLVAVGAGPVVEQGLALLRRGGSLVLLGMPASGVTAAFDPGELAHNGQRILGCKLGSARPEVDLPELVALYRAGRLRLDELVSGRFPLDRINDALRAARDPETLRNVIVF